jgi:tetratricopeptide (TPR) repeat protein
MTVRAFSLLRFAAPLALGLAPFAGCASSGFRGDSEVNRLVQHGRYEEAVARAKELVDEHPGDRDALETWRLASVALVLEHGRRLSFVDRDVEALAKFDEARSIAPDAVQVTHWREATLDKLADRWVTTAFEFHGSDDLPRASECYEKALEYRPDDSRAKGGLARVLVQLNYRRGMGDKYYQEGIEALQEYWLEQASHHFSATGKYDTENERAKSRRQHADTLRAEERVIRAEEMEQAGQYAAARNEYRLATLFDSEHKPAIDGLERMKVEEKAAELMRECERRILRREFEAAVKVLDEGLALTVMQKEVFETEKERLDVARRMVRYEYARALEVDHRFEEAVAVYQEVIDASPQGFFEDSLARRDTLQDLLAKAADYYERALAAQAPEEQRTLLLQVQIVYPEYKDVNERLKSFEAAPQEPQKPR